MKINYFKLEDNDYVILKKIFEKNITILNDSNNFTKIIKGLFEKKNKNKRIEKQLKEKQTNSDLKIITDLGKKYFEKYGFQNKSMTNENYFVELGRYECNLKDDNVIDVFSWHKDDGAVIDYYVNTIVFYLEKSKDIVGGDFKLKINDKETIIPIESGMVLCFNGNLEHTVIPCSGEGKRDTIVFQIEREG